MHPHRSHWITALAAVFAVGLVAEATASSPRA